jgi:Type II secretion system (T2SS), protein E, N-terminal domain
VSDDALALAFRAGLPFVGLRDHEPDPEVDRVVPPEAAAAAGVVALAASDDHVRFAVAHPDVNLGSLAPYLGNRRVELAIAPSAELEAIVGAAPRPPAEPPPAGQETLLPVTEDEPAAASEPLAAAEPAAGAEPMTEDEPVAAPEPLAAAEPAAGAEPITEDEPLAAPEPLDSGEPVAAAEPGTEAQPVAAAEPLDPGEPPAAAEPIAEQEPPAVAEAPAAEPQPLAAAEASAEQPPRPTAAELLAAATTPGAEELLGATPAQPDEAEHEPAQDEGAAVEGQPEAEAPPVERYKAHPEPPDPGEDPSWLAPPSRLKRVLRVLLVLMLLIVIAGGALLAYLLTR